MDNSVFLGLVKNNDFNDDYVNYVKTNDLLEIFNLIHDKASWVEIQNVNYIINKIDIKVPIDILVSLLVKNKYELSNESPNYLFSDISYVDKLATINPYGYNGKLLIEKASILGGLTVDNFRVMLKNRLFKVKDIPNILLNDPMYAKAMIEQSVDYLEYLDEGGLTNDNISLALSKGFKYTPSYKNSKLISNPYFGKKTFESGNGYGIDLILANFKNNSNFLSSDEISDMIINYINKGHSFNKGLLNIIMYQPSSMIKIIDVLLNNNVNYINDLPNDILSDENNNIVKKAIDKGYTLTSDSNSTIKKNINYINYMIDNIVDSIKLGNILKNIDSSIIDNPSNGIVIKIIDKIDNIYSFPNTIYNYPEYVVECLKKFKNSNIIQKCSLELLMDESNDIMYTILTNKLELNLLHYQIILKKQEYIEYFLDNYEKVSNISPYINDHIDLNILLDTSNNILERFISIGYRFSDRTPKELFSDYNCVKIFLNSCNNSWLDINQLFKLVDKELLYDESNSLILDFIGQGLQYREELDPIVLSKSIYVQGLINNNTSYLNEMINNLPVEVLQDEEVIILAIENGYQFNEKSNSLLFQPKFLNKFFERLTTNKNDRMNSIIKLIDDNIINDSDNSIIKCIMDNDYWISDKTSSNILNNPELLKYYFTVCNEHCMRKTMELVTKEIVLDESNGLVYSAINSGYELGYGTREELLHNYNYVKYALELNKFNGYKNIPKEFFTKEIVTLMLINKIYSYDDDFKEKVIEYDLVLLARLRVGLDLKVPDEYNELYKFLQDKDITLDTFPKDKYNDYQYVYYFIFKDPNIIDLMDEQYLTKDLIILALKNKYVIKDIARFNIYFNKIGNIEEIIKYNSSIIEVLDEYWFVSNNYDYEKVLDLALKFHYDYKSNLINLPKNLDNETYIRMVVSKHGMSSIINNINFDLPLDIFSLALDNYLTLYNLNDKIKDKILTDDNYFNLIIDKVNDPNTLVGLYELFALNPDNPKCDVWFNKINQRITISDKKEFMDKLAYLLNKNKELFNTLNVRILSDYFSFLDVEIINRIVPDDNIQRKLVQMSIWTHGKENIKIFNLCIVYLLGLIPNNVNINDILYQIVSNLDHYGNLCSNISKEWNNIDKLIEIINMSELQGKSLDKLNNLINVLCNSNNYLSISSHKLLDNNNFNLRKEEYFNNIDINSLDIKELKEYILLKSYNIDYKRSEFLYKRYCYKESDIADYEDENLKYILHDIKFVFECDDIDLLKNTLLSAPINKVDLYYSVFIENVLRNEYVSAYNKVLDNGNKKKVEGNVFELEENFNMLIHVLGGYNRSYVEPSNFKDAWNIELMQNHGICTSFLSDQNLSTAPRNYPTLGFSRLEPNSILLSEPDDIVSNNYNTKYATSLITPCCFLFPEKQIDETRWHHNEIVLERKKLNSKDNEEYKRQPDYIIYIAEDTDVLDNLELDMNKIKNTDLWRMTLKASQDFNVPILIVNRVKISKKEHDEIDKMKDELVSTKNWLLVNKIIVRYINNLMGTKVYFEKQELNEFIDNCIELINCLEYKDSKQLLEVLMYTINEENRKFNDHKTRDTFNYLAGYEDIIKNKLIELENNYQENSKNKDVLQ